MTNPPWGDNPSQPQPPQQPPQQDPYGGYQYVPGQTPPPPGQTPPPGAPGGYGQNYGRSSQGNKPATLALIFGLLAFICGILTGIPAIILGFIGRRRANELGGEGSGKALAGIILGFFNLIVSIIFVVIIVITGGFSVSTRSGDTVHITDATIGTGHVDVGSDANVEFSTTIRNDRSFSTAYKVHVLCTGGGESHEKTVDTETVSPDETIDFSTDVQFDATSGYLSVVCSIQGMKFK
jgi:hypothetical protein